MALKCYKYFLVGVKGMKTIMTNEFPFCTITTTNHNINKIKLESNHETWSSKTKSQSMKKILNKNLFITCKGWKHETNGTTLKHKGTIDIE